MTCGISEKQERNRQCNMKNNKQTKSQNLEQYKQA